MGQAGLSTFNVCYESLFSNLKKFDIDGPDGPKHGSRMFEAMERSVTLRFYTVLEIFVFQ